MNNMTREEILAMEPGSELDVLVAEKVMHLHIVPDCLPSYPRYYLPDTELILHAAVPHYSGILFEAWEVLEKPEIMDKYQIGVYPTSFGKWIARPFMPGGRDCTVQADTAPEAICKCALLAVLEV